MKCCSAERSTPFCPLCGRKLANPSPMVEVLAYLKKNQQTAFKKWQAHEKHCAQSYNDRKERDREKNRYDRMTRWSETVEAAMKGVGEQASICADYLEENGQAEAAKMLRGAFQ